MSALRLGLSVVLLAACGSCPPAPARDTQEEVQEGERVRLVLEQASVRDVARILGRMTGRPVVIGSRADTVADCTTVSVLHEGTVSAERAVQLAQTALEEGPVQLERRGDVLTFTANPEVELAPCLPEMTPTLAPAAEPEVPELDLDAHVRRGAESEARSDVQVTRAAMDTMWVRPETQARIVPRTNAAGEFECIALHGMRRRRLLSRLGLRNGDCVRDVNGYDLRSPDAVLEAYSQLRDVDRWEITLDREGQALTIVVTLVDSLDAP
ncbi:MAG: hypothetical protein AB8I08_36500 [Sandaracinaceae bacterium]